MDTFHGVKMFELGIEKFPLQNREYVMLGKKNITWYKQDWDYS